MAGERPRGVYCRGCWIRVAGQWLCWWIVGLRILLVGDQGADAPARGSELARWL